MKSKRKTMLGVALAVAVIALAGIGYAVAGQYIAKTTSNDNAISAEYNTIKLFNGNTATENYGNFMLSGIELDTENDGGTITYDFHDKTIKLKKTDSVWAFGGESDPANAVAISNTLTVKVDATHGDGGILEATVTNGFSTTGLTFVVVVNDTAFFELTTLSSKTNIASFTAGIVNPITIDVYAVVTGENFTWVEGTNNNMSIEFLATANAS